MTSSVVLEEISDLREAIAKSLRRFPLQAPMVYEQNDCVVVELPAPRIPDDALDVRLEGEHTLIIGSHTDKTYQARVALPARVSVADCVAYYLGGILSLTFLKADAADALDEDVDLEDMPAFALALAAC